MARRPWFPTLFARKPERAPNEDRNPRPTRRLPSHPPSKHPQTYFPLAPPRQWLVMDWTPSKPPSDDMGIKGSKEGRGAPAAGGAAGAGAPRHAEAGRLTPSSSAAASENSMQIAEASEVGSRNGDSKGAFGAASAADPLRRRFSYHSVEMPNSNGLIYDVPKNYQLKRKLGQGAYGFVCKVSDVSTNPPTDFAIKRCHNMFHGSMTDAKRILREVKILRHLSHENVIKLQDLFGPPDAKGNFDTVYIVMEFMQTDLRRVIYSRNELGDEHVQCISYQILMGLKYLHSAKIWHRDLKPANILLNSDCTVKICDFGLSRGHDGALDQTDYVVTRWYRAPEVMCSAKYGSAIDLWAVGCIVAELHGRKPLFKGESYKDQVCKILRILGVPSEADFDAVMQNKAARNYVLRYLQKVPDRKGRDLAELYPRATDSAVGLMRRLLQFNPVKRLTAAQALAHPYFTDIRETECEVECPSVFDWSYEAYTKTKPAMQAEFRREFAWHIKRNALRYGQQGSGTASAAAGAPSNETTSVQSTNGTQQPSSEQNGAAPMVTSPVLPEGSTR